MAFFSRKPTRQSKPEAWVTPEERAASNLSVALSENNTEADEHIVLVDEELKRKKIQAERQQKEEAAKETVAEMPQSERQSLRVLLVTSETSLLTAGGALEREYAELAEYLNELHIIVITMRKDAEYQSRRITANVWIYPTNSRSPLFALYDVYKIVKSQMAFAAGFRADIVVATDPFEAGAAAYIISKRYDRPLQLQLSVDPFEKDFVQEHEGNKWRLWAAKFLIPRAICMLARSKHMEAVLAREYPDIVPRMTLLPRFHNLSAFRDSPPTFDLRERYPQFKFIILVVSQIDARSVTDLAINVCAPFLRQYPTVGLVIVGDGPLRNGLEKKVASDKLQEKVIFESDASDVISHLKSANLFLNVSMDEEYDTMLAAAAAAGLPVLTVASNMADLLFEDGVSASVCPENDMVCLQARIGEFLNDNQLRATFSINGREQVFSLMEQDVDSYRRAFIGSFESCVLKTYTAPE